MAHLINRSIATQSAQLCNLLRQVTPRFIARNLRNVLKAIALFQQRQHVWSTVEGEEGKERGLPGGNVARCPIEPRGQNAVRHEAMRLRRFLSTCLLCGHLNILPQCGRLKGGGGGVKGEMLWYRLLTTKRRHANGGRLRQLLTLLRLHCGS